VRQISPLPKICPKKESGEEKEFCFFFLLHPKKGKEARSTSNGRQPIDWHALTDQINTKGIKQDIKDVLLV